MRKPQSQPSLATPTDTDREQLAAWLRREQLAAEQARFSEGVTEHRPRTTDRAYETPR